MNAGAMNDKVAYPAIVAVDLRGLDVVYAQRRRTIRVCRRNGVISCKVAAVVRDVKVVVWSRW